MEFYHPFFNFNLSNCLNWHCFLFSLLKFLILINLLPWQLQESTRGRLTRWLLLNLSHLFLINYVTFLLVNIIRLSLLLLLIRLIQILIILRNTVFYKIHSFIRMVLFQVGFAGGGVRFHVGFVLGVYGFVVLLMNRPELFVRSKLQTYFGVKHGVRKFERFSVAAIVLIHNFTNITLHQFLIKQLFTFFPFWSDIIYSFNGWLLTRSSLTFTISHHTTAAFMRAHIPTGYHCLLTRHLLLVLFLFFFIFVLK